MIIIINPCRFLPSGFFFVGHFLKAIGKIFFLSFLVLARELPPLNFRNCRNLSMELL